MRRQLEEIGHCRFMEHSEFSRGVEALKGKKIVFVGCGAQGLHQGLDLRDSGLDVSYTLRKEAIEQKRQSWKNATENGFKVGTYEEMIPDADLVCNLTPDKQHHNVIPAIMKLMKKARNMFPALAARSSKRIKLMMAKKNRLANESRSPPSQL